MPIQIKSGFNDMKADGRSLDDKRTPTAENDIPDIIARFHNLDEEEKRETYRTKFFSTVKKRCREWIRSLPLTKYKKIKVMLQ